MLLSLKAISACAL